MYNSSNDEIVQKFAYALGGNTANFLPLIQKDHDYVAITINPPRTKWWTHRTSVEQANTLKLLLSRISNNLDLKCKKGFNYAMEYCKDGQVHMHGYISIPKGNVMSFAGLVNDVARVAHRIMPAKSFTIPYNEKYYNTELCKYQSPCICIKICDNVERWLAYMYKDVKPPTDSSTPPQADCLVKPQIVSPIKKKNTGSKVVLLQTDFQPPTDSIDLDKEMFLESICK